MHGVSADHSPRAHDDQATWPAAQGSSQGSFLQPVYVEQALGKEPRSIDLRESVKVAERGDHQAALSGVRHDVMREAVGFPCGAITVERKDGALSNEMRRGIVPVQVREDWSSWEGFGSLAFMCTTKWVSVVNRAIWPFASGRSGRGTARLWPRGCAA